MVVLGKEGVAKCCEPLDEVGLEIVETCAREAAKVHILAGAAIRKKYGLDEPINRDGQDGQDNGRRDHKGEQGYTDEVDCCGNCIQRIESMCGFGRFPVSYMGGCDNHTRPEGPDG